MKLALNPNYSRKSLESMYITNTCIYTHAHTLTHTPPTHTHTHTHTTLKKCLVEF